MRTAGNESGEVSHIYEIECADFVGDLTHSGEINDAWIGAATTDDQLRTFLLRKLLEFVVVDGLGLFGDAVRNDLVRLAGKVEVMAVRKVPAMGQIQSENRISRLKDGGVGFHVGL